MSYEALGLVEAQQILEMTVETLFAILCLNDPATRWPPLFPLQTY